MYSVSDEYKVDFYKDFRNNSFAEISFSIEEKAPRADSTTTCNVNEMDYSSYPWESNTKPIISVATLEDDRLKLDGSLSVYNEDAPLNSNFVAEEISDENGEFETNPIITITFGTEYSFAGLNLLFDEFSKEYAIDFEIKAYQGATLLDTHTVIGNANYNYNYIHNYNDVDKITIEFMRVLPYHRARLSYLTYGIEKIWGNDDLLEDGLIYTNRVDPLSRELPENSIEFTIDNYENLFNPDNPSGLYQYLHENIEVSARLGYLLDSGSIEWVTLGKFYLSEWSADDYSARFKAVGILNTLTNMYLEEAPTTTTIQSVSLADKLEQLMFYEGLNTHLTYDNSLENIYTTAPLPNATVAECLQYIANAGNCILYTDRNGYIHIEPYNSQVQDFKIDSNIAEEDGRELELESILKNVNVKWYKYVIGDTKAVYSGDMEVSGVVLTTINLEKPAQDISVSVSGADLLTYVAGFMRVDIAMYSETSQTAYITINGREIEAVEQDYVENVNNSGEDAELDNPVITNMENATSVALYTKNILNKRNKYKIQYRGAPELDACDKVLFDSKFSQNLTYLVTSNKITFNGGIMGELEGRVI